MLLDDPQRLAALDASGMLHCLHDLPDVALSSFEGGASQALPIATPKLILVCGMGGSAISGDLLRTLALATCSAPIMVHRGDRLPAFVDSACLVVVMSYSGNTAESLGCLHDALERQVPLVVISSGGEASKLAHSHKRSLLTIPGGKQPRAALGELFFSLLGLTSPLTGITEEDVRSTVRALVRLRQQIDVSVPLTDNPAKALAMACHGRRILIAGTTPISEAIANRWKCQFNENAKLTVQLATFPELTHNDVVNLLDASDPTEMALVFADPEDSTLIRRQRQICLDLFKEKGLLIEVLGAIGDTALERCLSSVYLGDYVSVYLAFLKNVDPTPVDAITRLKTRMQSIAESAR